MIRRTRLLAPLLALPLAACGTTVQGSDLAASGSGDGLTVQRADGPPAGPAGGQGAGSRPGQPQPARSRADAGGPAGSAGSGATSAPRTGSGAPSGQALRGPVRVGVLYIDGAEAVASNLGISGLTTGDAWAQAKAVVAHLNATGGLAGRPIDLREGRMDAARMVSDVEGSHAAACASLAQDQKVSYVVSYVNLTQSRLACYAKHGITVLDDQAAVADSAGARYAATFGGPGELAPGRATQELVDALWRRGWLTPTSKVGTFVPDTPDGAEIETRYLVPALARHGLTPVARARASTGAGGASQNSTVLQFRSAGVDRVIPMLQSPLFLMNSAESQGYRPAYAVNSGFGPGALLESAAPRAQLEKAAGIGWSPFLDIGAGDKPGPVSSNETLCFALMRKAGQQSTSGTTQAFQAALCNVLMFLKSATDRYGVTPDLLEAVRGQGLRFLPADAFAVRMQTGRADGVSAYRDLAFDGDCGCFQYVSGNRATR